MQKNEWIHLHTKAKAHKKKHTHVFERQGCVFPFRCVSLHESNTPFSPYLIHTGVEKLKHILWNISFISANSQCIIMSDVDTLMKGIGHFHEIKVNKWSSKGTWFLKKQPRMAHLFFQDGTYQRPNLKQASRDNKVAFLVSRQAQI